MHRHPTTLKLPQKKKQRIHSETITINSIRTKLNLNEAMIAKVDKSNALVILPITQYDNKIQDFITANSFKKQTRTPQNASKPRSEVP
jgi:hypothetical protein